MGVYLGLMVLTLTVAGICIGVQNSGGEVPPAIRPIFLVLIFAQWCALIWYIASFIPYGQTMIKKFFKSVETSNDSKMTPSITHTVYAILVLCRLPVVLSEACARTRRAARLTPSPKRRTLFVSYGTPAASARGSRAASRTSSRRRQPAPATQCCCAHADQSAAPNGPTHSSNLAAPSTTPPPPASARKIFSPAGLRHGLPRISSVLRPERISPSHGSCTSRIEAPRGTFGWATTGTFGFFRPSSGSGAKREFGFFGGRGRQQLLRRARN